MRLMQKLKSVQSLALCSLTTWLLVLAESILIMTSDPSTQKVYLEPLRIFTLFANMFFFTLSLVILGHPKQLRALPRRQRCMEAISVMFLTNWTFVNLEVALRWQKVDTLADNQVLFQIFVQMAKQLIIMQIYQDLLTIKSVRLFAYALPAFYYFVRCKLYTLGVGEAAILVLFWSLSALLFALVDIDMTAASENYQVVKKQKSLKLNTPKDEKQIFSFSLEKQPFGLDKNSLSEVKHQKIGTHPDKKIVKNDEQDVASDPKRIPKEIILDKLSDGIVVLNDDGKFECFNSSVAKLLDCSKDEVVEKLLSLPNKIYLENRKTRPAKQIRKSDTIPVRGKNDASSLTFVDHDFRKTSNPRPSTVKVTLARKTYLQHDEKSEAPVNTPVKDAFRNVKAKPTPSQNSTAKKRFFPNNFLKTVKGKKSEKPGSSTEVDEEEQAKLYQEKFEKYFEEIFNDGVESDSRDVRGTVDQVLKLLIDLRDNIFDSHHERNNISPSDLKIKMRYSATGVSRKDRFFRKFTIRSSFAVRVESFIKREKEKPRSLEILINPILVEGDAFLVIQLRDVSDREMVKQLKAINRQQNSSLASITHEFRSPLNGVLSMLEVLKPQISPNLREKYLQPASTSASTLLFLVNDILDLHQMQAKELRLVFMDCNLAEICQNSMNIIKFKADMRGIALEINLSPEIPKIIHTDPHRLHQILVNLLSNAIKFTQNGKISIDGSYLPQRKVKLQVSDTGIGIEQENLEKLFKSFGKIDLGVNNDLNPQGTGLGLYISNGLAKRLNATKGEGGLTVTSYTGEGTCFSFIIDDMSIESENVDFLDEVETVNLGKMLRSMNDTSSYVIHKELKINESDLSIISKPSSPLRKRISFTHKTSISSRFCACSKILVVDDDEVNIWALKTQLESLHIMKVDAARNGEEAIQKVTHKLSQIKTCCSGCYVLIFMDCEMPIKNGLVATKEIREYTKDKTNQRPTIIGVSGHSSLEFYRKCQEAGMDNVFTKPIESKILKSILSSLNLG